jgi:hypothetical protein
VIPVTPKPQYPDVPQSPGVPPLLRQAGNVQNNIGLLASDAVSVLRLFNPAQWGLFDSSGQPAFGTPGGGIVSAALQVLGAGGQSVGDIEYRLDYRIATAPQEMGAFLSYNKVSTPFNGRVSYIVGGLESQRGAFLQQVLAAEQALTLYSLVMPEITYPSCNVTHHDYRRTSQRGVALIVVDVWVEEVRISGTTQYSNTQQPSGANPTNGGTVQPQTPTPQQQSSFLPGEPQ